jgi:2-polyprenyl-6-methoxyphenol hydroxylase-like FAD-dependent oxidoreductase
MKADNRSAEVAGAGPAGLFAATALAQLGWRVRVHEQASELRMFGAGLWLWENGLGALKAIGALPSIMENDPEHLTAWLVRDHKGRVAFRRPTKTDDRLISPPRGDVYDSLIAAARNSGVEIVTSSQVVGASADGTVSFADGSTSSADLVIAADGVNSRIRNLLGLTKFYGLSRAGATRLLIPRLPHETESEVVEYWRGSRCFMFNPVSATEVYLCLICGADDERGKQIPLDKETWIESYPDFRSAIERIGDEGRWDVFTTVKCTSWSKGRVAIVGDAAHALPPSLGQAANLAFANSLALATYVTTGTDVESSLRDWERDLRPVTDHTQRWSDLRMKVEGFWPESWQTMRSFSVKAVTSLPPVERMLNRPMRTPLIEVGERIPA